MSAFDARRLPEPRLTFSKDVPSHSGPNAWNGLNLYGPFDNSRVDLPAKSILFVFPNELKHLAHKLAAGLKENKRFRGFQQMFRVPFDGSKMDYLTFKADLSSGAAAAASYREEIVRWSETAGRATRWQRSCWYRNPIAGRRSGPTTSPRRPSPGSASRPRWSRPT